ncbi:cytochrome P450, family 706, subfamily A, polypeptide 6 [Hibiscus trionum]|uniref:Cytochrome P450, family 706, subfamily A, polypeptide 6 n=1 Tax=Hibiscus trionum TaxID=183268 RepID=A0A9W7H8K1_HIBTR|nr:cytochrome P450, family 706, subfamily A, polypeptide 6 [Hibiscus trionum]
MYLLRRKETRKAVDYLYVNAGEPVNIGEQMFLTVLNVVTKMLWGSSVVGDAGANIGAEFKQAMSEITEILGLPNISDFFPVLAPLDLQGLYTRILKPVAKLNGIIDNMIDQRLKVANGSGESSGEVKDFLQFLIQLKEKNDSKTPLTMDHIKALLLDMVIGGTR